VAKIKDISKKSAPPNKHIKDQDQTISFVLHRAGIYKARGLYSGGARNRKTKKYSHNHLPGKIKWLPDPAILAFISSNLTDI